MNDLDMKPYSTKEAVRNIGSNGIYELVGVVNHHGQSMGTIKIKEFESFNNCVTILIVFIVTVIFLRALLI